MYERKNKASNETSQQQRKQRSRHDWKFVGVAGLVLSARFSSLAGEPPELIAHYSEPWFEYFYVPLTVLWCGAVCCLSLRRMQNVDNVDINLIHFDVGP